MDFWKDKHPYVAFRPHKAEHEEFLCILLKESVEKARTICVDVSLLTTPTTKELVETQFRYPPDTRLTHHLPERKTALIFIDSEVAFFEYQVARCYLRNLSSACLVGESWC